MHSKQGSAPRDPKFLLSQECELHHTSGSSQFKQLYRKCLSPVVYDLCRV